MQESVKIYLNKNKNMDNFIQDPNQQPKKRTILKLVIALIILSLVGGTGYYFMQSDGGFFRGMIIKNVDKKVDASKKVPVKTSAVTKSETKSDLKSQFEAAKAAAKAKAEEEAKAKLEQEAADRAAARASRDEAEERDDGDDDNDENEGREEESIDPYLTVEHDDSFVDVIPAQNNQVISRFRITASEADVTLNRIKLRFGSTLPSWIIDDIELFDGNNTYISEVRQVDDYLDILFRIDNTYTIHRDETVYFYVLADIPSPYTNGEMNICIQRYDSITARQDDVYGDIVSVNIIENSPSIGVCSVSEIHMTAEY